MFWRQKRTGRAREGAAGAILIQRQVGAPLREGARLAHRAAAGAAEEKVLMMHLLSGAPGETNPLPALERNATSPAGAAADNRREEWSVGRSDEHEYEHEGGAAWHTIGPR